MMQTDDAKILDDALRLLKDWMYFAKTMHDAGIIALPSALLRETASTLASVPPVVWAADQMAQYMD